MEDQILWLEYHYYKPFSSIWTKIIFSWKMKKNIEVVFSLDGKCLFQGFLLFNSEDIVRNWGVREVLRGFWKWILSTPCGKRRVKNGKEKKLVTKEHEIYPPIGPERRICTNWHHYRSFSEAIRALNYDNFKRPLLLTLLEEFAFCLRGS